MGCAQKKGAGPVTTEGGSVYRVRTPPRDFSNETHNNTQKCLRSVFVYAQVDEGTRSTLLAMKAPK